MIVCYLGLSIILIPLFATACEILKNVPNFQQYWRQFMYEFGCHHPGNARNIARVLWSQRIKGALLGASQRICIGRERDKFFRSPGCSSVCFVTHLLGSLTQEAINCSYSPSGQEMTKLSGVFPVQAAFVSDGLTRCRLQYKETQTPSALQTKFWNAVEMLPNELPSDRWAFMRFVYLHMENALRAQHIGSPLYLSECLLFSIVGPI